MFRILSILRVVFVGFEVKTIFLGFTAHSLRLLSVLIRLEDLVCMVTGFVYGSKKVAIEMLLYCVINKSIKEQYF